MKKIHIAISTDNTDAGIEDYIGRLSCKPCLLIIREYILWRTATVNLSVRKDSGNP